MSRIDPEETKQWKKTADTIEALHTEYSEVSQVIRYCRDKNTKDSEDRSQARDGSCSNSCGSETTTGVVPLTKEEWLDKESKRRSLRRYLMESSSHGIHLWSCSLNRSTQMSRKKRLRWLEQAWTWGYQTNPCIQPLRVEDVIYHLHDCKIFTKLDPRQGYKQLALDPTTRQVATSNTPWGNFRPRRLLFGAKSSQNVFDQAMFRIFGDIAHFLNHRDDILFGGREGAEHRHVLKSLKTVIHWGEIMGSCLTKGYASLGEQIKFFGNDL